MAEVEEVMHDMLPELHDLKRKQIFSEPEIRQIIRKRRNFEYLLVKHPPRQQDFLAYARYEIALECLKRQRRKAMGERSTKGHSVHSGIRRMHDIFRRGLGKFRADLRFWYQYIDFCLRSGSTKTLLGVLMRAVKFHPREVPLWLLAADRELKMGHTEAARKLLLRGLRLSSRSAKLWSEMLRLEIHVASHVKENREQADKEEQEGAEPETVMHAAKGKKCKTCVWVPVQAILHQGLKRFVKSPRCAAHFLGTARTCLEKAALLPNIQDLQILRNDVDVCIAERRPRVGSSIDEAPADVAVAFWELWWSGERARGRSWQDVVQATEEAPSIVVEHLAATLKDVTVSRTVEFAGSDPPSRLALMTLAASPQALQTARTAMAVLEALEGCANIHGSTASVYTALMRNAANKHPTCCKLGVMARQLEPIEPIHTEPPTNVDPHDAAQLLLLSAASKSAGQDYGNTFDELLLAVKAGEPICSLLNAFLMEALSKGFEEFNVACNHVLKSTDRLLVPGIKKEVLIVVLSAELRVYSPPQAHRLQIFTRFEDLLSRMSNKDEKKIVWWVRYIEYVLRAQRWGVGDGLPTSTELYERGMRTFTNQVLFSEQVNRVLQSST